MRRSGHSLLDIRASSKANTGFSLIELLVVIAVIAALLAILIPGLGKARAMAKRMKCAFNLRQIDLAMRLYLSDNKDTYPCAQDPLDPNNPTIWLWMGLGWRGFIAPYFNETIDANNPSVLQCPADKPDPRYESTSYQYSMAFYHSPQQINSMTSKEDTYLNPPKPSVQQESDRVTNPAGKIIVGEWSSNHRRIEQGQDPGWWGWTGCRNFLFANGTVLFLEAEKIRPANDGNPNPILTIDGIEGVDWPR